MSATQLDATSSVAGTFRYDPSAGTVLDAGLHQLTATFIPADSRHYTTATASATITVDQATPALTWNTPQPIVYGTPLSAAQLSAAAAVPGTFSYSPQLGTILRAGQNSLFTTFTPNDLKNYKPADASVSIQVDPAAPQLQWASLSPIAINIPLSAGQLSLTATSPVTHTAVEGSFRFSPPAGTLLTSPGPQQITAVFVPADRTDYLQATATTTITVQPFGVVAWGDSLTQGNKADYPSILARLLTLPVVNQGIGGETSTQIAVREGAVTASVQIAGGAIPAEGPVEVTFPSGYEPVSKNSPRDGMAGVIAGIHGSIAHSEGSLLFTRTTAGAPVPVPAPVPFVVDKPYAAFLPIFWEGRNNFLKPAQVYADLAAQVATVPASQDYVVLSIPNMDAQLEWKGAANYSPILALNNQLANIYGSHFIDIRQILINQFDPSSAIDLFDLANDVPPTSLRDTLGTGTLTASIGPADKVLAVNISSGTIRPSNILTIGTGSEAENVQVSAVSGSSVTVVRGFGGTIAAHAAGTSVAVGDALHLNEKGYQVVAGAIAQYIARYTTSSTLSPRRAVAR